jgi:WD40 repeat protein
MGPVYSVIYSPSGEWIASGGYDKSPRVWSTATGEIIRVLDECRFPISDLQVDRSGKILVAASDVMYKVGQIRIWRTTDWSQVRILDIEYGDQNSQRMALSPDGRKLAAYQGDLGVVILRDIATGADVLTVPVRRRTYPNEKFGYAGELIFTAAGDALIWAGGQEPPDRIPLANTVAAAELSTKLRNIDRLSRLPDGTVAMLGANGFELWNRGGSRFVPVSTRALSPDASLAATGENRALVVTDVATGERVYRMGERPNMPTTLGNLGRHFVVAANPLYPMIAASAPDGYIRLWDLRTRQGPVIFKAHDHSLEALVFSPTGRWLASGADNLKIWDAWTARLIREIPTENPLYLAFSTQDRWLVAVGRFGVTLIDSSDWSTKEIKLEPTHHVSGVFFEPGAEFFVISNRNRQLVSFSVPDLTSQSQDTEAPVGSLAASRSSAAFVYSGHKWIDGQMRTFMDKATPPPESAAIWVDFTADRRVFLINGSPYAYASALHPDGNILATASGGGEVNVWGISRPEQPDKWLAHPGGATSICWTSDGRYLVTTGMDGAVRLWDGVTHRLAATMVSFSQSDYVIAAAGGQYTATRGGLAGVVFRIGDRAVPFDQFDLTLNRPDLVHDNLGYAYHDLIDSFRVAHERRLRRMGIADRPLDLQLDLPELEIVSAPIPTATAAGSVRLRVKAAPSRQPLSRLLVYVNDVPYPNRHGTDIGESADPMEKEIEIPLSAGRNRIEIGALSAGGTESLRQVINITRTGGGTTPRLFLLAIGVSGYRESSLNLTYAGKDADDIAATIQELQKHFASVETRVLRDEKATRKEILDSREFLARSNFDDQVIIFFSGHGTLRGSDYFFLPHDFDPANVAATGLHYDSIETLLDGLAARRRLVLLDTCHAGEADYVEPRVPATPETGPARGVKFFRPAPRYGNNARRIGITDRMLGELFADLRRGAGAFVIAASSAAEYAIERDALTNGVFTYCVLEALRDNQAIRVSELYQYVSSNVVELTGGRQQPISRRENLTNDFVVI